MVTSRLRDLRNCLWGCGMTSDQSFIRNLQRQNKKLFAKIDELKKLNEILQDNCRILLRDNIMFTKDFVKKNKLIRDPVRRTRREGYRTCYRCRKVHMMYFMVSMVVDKSTRWFCGECYEI